ncbi:MAG: thioredoxin domain-containing protein [Deltaproteobacteria bacterium]|nr:thioredoxin domain-containing protein [Deltaproteobacteria bacterium]
MQEALAQKGAGYVPRTKHRSADGGPKYVNRLIFETSPYLAQHAHNPVSWFPWGDEAFALARQLRRPVFLSVGYSTCHWCHVMEEESFEDEEVAKVINDHYIPIKVDREERPDVDAIYMRSVQLLAGRGGWPMSVWLTPDRKPFYAGTYFPARDGDRGSRKGLMTLLQEQQLAFQQNPTAIAADADRITAQIQRDMAPPRAQGLPSAATVRRAAQVSKRRYDSVHGGVRGQPKFPSSFPIRLLLRHGRRAGDETSSTMAVETLQKMQAGGIYDHVAGGFHRYAVDQRWLVPHFEKMLYDNGLLTMAYLEGYQQSGSPGLARVARETLDYIQSEMTSVEGGYYSATDADSIGPAGHREEGYFFTWTPAEITAVLGAQRAQVVMAYYAVSPRGNFEQGRSILSTPRSPSEVASELGMSVDDLEGRLDEAIPILRDARNKRAAPIRDDKIQVSWNGLMIAAMARGAWVLDEPRYERSAVAAAEFLLTKLVVGGRLQHSTMDGRTTTAAFAEDYAFLAGGLVDLFEATQDLRWLDAAVTMMEQLETHHGRGDGGGYFRTAADAEKLLARQLEQHDGAIPSAGSWALMTHLRLWALTHDDQWRQRAERTLGAHAETLRERPWALNEMVMAVDFYTDLPKEILLVLPEGMTAHSPAAAPLLRVIRESFVPNHVLVVVSGQPSAALAARVPWSQNKPARRGKPTAYVCKRGSCELPTGDPQVFAKQLGKVVPYGDLGGD